MAVYLNVTVNDTVTLSFGLNDVQNLAAYDHLFVGMKTLSPEFAGMLDSLSADIDINNIELEFTIAGTYEDVGGKFSKILGNVAIVDCNYLDT